MGNFKIALRLLTTIALYSLVGTFFLINIYFMPDNKDSETTNLLLTIVAAIVAYFFATKLVQLMWYNVDSIFAQTYSGGKIIFANRLGFNIATILYFIVILIGHWFKKDFSTLVIVVDAFFVAWVLNTTRDIYLKIRVRQAGEDIPEISEE